MADILVTVAEASRAGGSTASFGSRTGMTTTDAYLIPNNGRVGLLVQSTPGATLTVQTPNTIDGLAVADLSLIATAGKVLVWGAFPPNVYNDSAGRLRLTASAVAEVLAFRLG